jgi:hypothetical protein
MARFIGLLFLLAVLACLPGIGVLAYSGLDSLSGPPPLDPTPQLIEVPAAGIPRSLREWNWGGGSCVFASWTHAERRLSLYDLATYIRTHYSGGESYNGLTSKMQKLGVKYYSCIDGRNDTDQAINVSKGLYFIDWLEGQGYGWYGTFSGDSDVLERCTAERRMAVIFFKPNHSINFCGFFGDVAYLLDNNAIEKYETMPKQQFLKDWRNRYGGVAVVPDHGEPPPPIPYVALN